MTKVAVVALVEQDGKILAFRRTKDGDHEGNSMPGGKPEFGETFEEAIAREVKEETGYDIQVVPNVEPFGAIDDQGEYYSITFLCKIVGGKLVNDRPHEGHALWSTREELFAGPFRYYNMKCLKHFATTLLMNAHLEAEV